jgi:nickel-dependent lactate racemase
MPTLRYGKTTVSFEIPKPYSYDIIAYLNDDTDSLSELQSVSKIRQALEAPIGTPRLRELAAGQNRAVILISDGTRLCPSQLLLEPLLEELNSAGMADSAIDIVVALGLHRKHTA